MTNNSKINPQFVGQDFDDFLEEEGIAADVQAKAIKKVIVALLENLNMTQVDLAQRMQTSRTQIQRLLDPSNTSLTLGTLQRAADVAGKRLVIGFESVRRAPARRRRLATA
jgi:transcriptional regulator with XRE-family HTH domain